MSDHSWVNVYESSLWVSCRYFLNHQMRQNRVCRDAFTKDDGVCFCSFSQRWLLCSWCEVIRTAFMHDSKISKGRDVCSRRVLFGCMHHPGSPLQILMYLSCRGTNLPLESLLRPVEGARWPVFRELDVCVWVCVCSLFGYIWPFFKQGMKPEIRLLT